MQIAQFARAVFNLSAICKRKKCLFRSTHWSTVINLCNLCKLHNLQKRFSIWVQFPKWRNVCSDLHIGVPFSISVICANCPIRKSGFHLSAICKMKKCLFRTTHWSTVINLCNLCKLHNLQKRFSIWVQFPKWRNVCSDLHIGVPFSISVICANCTICKSGFQFECNLQNEEMPFQIYSLEDRTLINLCNSCKLHNLQKRSSI